MVREISLDTETTGLSFNDGDKLVEIGCVEMIDNVATNNVFHVYINPERDVPEEVVKIHGITGEFLSDKPVFKDIADDFLSFISDSNLVIHNASFDMGFINNELKMAGYDIIPMSRVIDTLALAREMFPGGDSKSLDALCKKFDIDNSSRIFHGALLDASLLAKVYLELRGGREPTFIGNYNAGKKKKVIKDNVKNEKIFHEERFFPPSEEELKAHNEFINNMKRHLWESQ